MNPAQRFTGWLRDKLGDRWPPLVKTVDGALTAFLIAFVGSLAAHGFFDGDLGTANMWKAAGLAGWLAAGSILKSGMMILLTGQPALGGLVSRQLRAQRELRTVRHPVPVRPATRSARPQRTRRAPKQPTAGTGRHEARPPGGSNR